MVTDIFFTYAVTALTLIHPWTKKYRTTIGLIFSIWAILNTITDTMNRKAEKRGTLEHTFTSDMLTVQKMNAISAVHQMVILVKINNTSLVLRKAR